MVLAWIILILVFLLGIAMIAWFIFLFIVFITSFIGPFSGGGRNSDGHAAENGSFYNENGDWIG